jgi:putative membrane protein
MRISVRNTFVLAGALLFSASASFAQGITDPQIAAIVVTANQIDVDAGNLALATTHQKSVKAFAQLMVTDHQGVNQAASELVTRLGVKPEENATSRSIKSGGDENLAALKQLSGAAFDRAYVGHEVAYHEQVLKALDDALIPNATNPELKALLVKVRPAFVAHLEHARHLLSSLGMDKQ